MTNDKIKRLIAFKIGNPKKLIRFTENGFDWLNSNIKKPTSEDFETWLIEYKQSKQDRTLKEKWKSIRSKRNILLRNSDKYFLTDSPISESDQLIWKDYRILLRDLPATNSDPFEIVFPVDPGLI